MKVVDFNESNCVFAKDHRTYLPLPAHRTQDGKVVSCWKPTWKERLQIIFGGILWLSVLTFNGPLQPLKLGTDKPELD
jgi:hypothetical protein